MKLAIALIWCVALAAAWAGCGDEPNSEARSVATTTTETSTGGDSDFPAETCRNADSPPNIINVTSYGTDCGAVEEAMRELEQVGREFRIGDFDCSRIAGTKFGGTWECRGEASYFTFEFGD